MIKWMSVLPIMIVKVQVMTKIKISKIKLVKRQWMPISIN